MKFIVIRTSDLFTSICFTAIKILPKKWSFAKELTHQNRDMVLKILLVSAL